MKIILSLAVSFLIVITLNKLVFFNGNPKVNPLKVVRTVKLIRDNLIIFKNKIRYDISKKKFDYNSQLVSDESNFLKFHEVVPTYAPTLIPEEFIPTSILTSTPVPTSSEIILVTKAYKPTLIIKTPIPTKKTKPRRLPTPLPTSTNSNNNFNVPNLTSPLSQPYYDPSKAYLCYNTDKFIEIYGGGVTPKACYDNVKSFVDSNLVSVLILGKSITVHKKSYPAFKIVSDELAKNTVAKKYKVNTIGAYVFRCNVNASKGDPYDTCNSGCVLSAHAFGIAVDINWDENCNGCSNYTMPIEIVDIFEKHGFRWGGRYKSVFGSTIDPMHFEYMYDLCKDLNN